MKKRGIDHQPALHIGRLMRLTCLLLLFCLHGFAKSPETDLKITGHVTGQNGEALSGVSVTIKNSTAGTATDANGNYNISVSDENAILIFSYVGYEKQEVPVGGRSIINITLSVSRGSLDEVVVVGYGTQKKLDVTGAISQIKGAEISKQSSVNAVSALQGKVAGVQITNTGAPGSVPEIRIRGLGTYWSSTTPLFVVDGVWYDDISFLNPGDIENVNVLKDASSEAIYGIRGANGVIIVTTKKGKSGRAIVTYNGSIGYQKVTNLVKMADAHEYAILFNELGRINNADKFLDSSQFSDGTNWYNQALRNALITNHQIGVSGGGEKNTYNFSLGYLNQNGVLKTNNYQRYTARFENDIQISKNIKTGYSVNGVYSLSNDAPGGIWHQLYAASPVLPVKFADGSYGDPGYYGLGTSVSNPQVTLDYNNAKSRIYQIGANAYTDIKFAKHFTYHGSFGVQYRQRDFKNYNPVYKATSIQRNDVSLLTVDGFNTKQWIAENTITYTNKFGDHSLTAMAGQNAQYFNYNESHATAHNVPNLSTGNWYLGLGNGGVGTIDDVDNASNQAYPLLSTVTSYFGRVNYSFKERYLLTATIRADGSSKFLGSDRFGYFPSVGAAWIISKEDFMKNVEVFNTLKLKASWGKVGNSSVPTFITTQQSVSGGAYSVIFGNSGTIGSGVSVASIPPPPLQWEMGIGTDIGIEAIMLKNRLTVEVDYYNKKTQRLVMDSKPVASVGTSSDAIITNVGDLQNRGLELALTWKDNVNKDFSYSISGNLAVNNNKFLTSISGDQKIFNGGKGATGGLYTTLITVGQPIGVFYGYKAIGVFQTQDEVNNYVDKNGRKFMPDAKPGDFKYQSLTGVGPISGNDRQVIGNPNPKYTYGLNTYCAYKQFDLAIDFQGVAGVDVYNANKGMRYGNENWTEDFYKKHWNGAGTSNAYPSVNIGGNSNYWPNSWFVENGSYFRVRNLQLGYTLSDKELHCNFINKLRIYLNAQNPFNFFKYSGFSPEVGGNPGNAGIDTDVYPLSATYNFGVNVTF